MLARDLISSAQEVLGTANQTKIFARITDAIAALANHGNWNPMIGYLDLLSNSDGNTVTLPRDVETPIAVNINGSPSIGYSRYSEFHLNGAGDNSGVAQNGWMNGGGCVGGVRWFWDDRGFVPTVMDVINASPLIAVSMLKNDLSATIRVFGYDQNGNYIRSQNPDGTWSDGFLVPINLLTDYPGGIIIPDDTRIFNRNFSQSTMNSLVSIPGHQLTTGALVNLAVAVGPTPAPLIAGAAYYVNVIDANTVQLFATQSGALQGIGAIAMTSAASSSSIVLTDKRQVSLLTQFTSATSTGLQTGTTVTLTGTTIPSPYIAGVKYYARPIDSLNFTLHNSVSDAELNFNPIDATTSGASVVANALQDMNPNTIITFSVTHDFLQGDAVQVSNASGQLPSPLLPSTFYYVRYISATSITLHTSLADSSTGANPIVITTGGSGSTAVFKTMSASATVGNANNIHTSSGHNLNTGDYVQFSSTGTMPSANIVSPAQTGIIQGTNYEAQTPSTSDSFTLADLSGNAFNVTTTGTGQLQLIISRAMGIAFDNTWETDTTAIATGDTILFSTTGAMPATTPQIDTVTTFYVRVVADGKVQVYDTHAHAVDLAHTTGLVTITSLGTGVLSLVLQRSVTVTPFSSSLVPSDAQYLADGSTVQFITSGTLPSPLAVSTNYKVYVVNGLLSIYTAGGSPISISSVGSGTHYMQLSATFGVSIPTSVFCKANEYSTGDSVVIGSTGTLPSPLVAGTYYLRAIDNDSVEIYDTLAHANDTSHTTGRITLLNVGAGTHTFKQTLPNWLVSKVSRVQKSATLGVIELYAWDTGRTNNLTLLGRYEPSETDPQYRRIKLGTNCACVRMMYRRRTYEVTSLNDYIPLTSKRAIITMIKALDFEDKDFLDKAMQYEKKAVEYLNLENSWAGGPEGVQIQFNDSIWTDPSGEDVN